MMLPDFANFEENLLDFFRPKIEEARHKFAGIKIQGR